MIWVGGRGDFIEKYLEPLAIWHRQGWNITSFDWRGQGGSRGDINYGHLSSFDPLIEDVDALVSEWLLSTPAPHILLGHSMGGHLLLRLVAERKPAIDAVVLISPMIAINAAPIPPWLGRHIARTMVMLGWGEHRAWKQNERPAPTGSTRQGYLTSCPDRYADELWWKEKYPDFDIGPPSWGWLDAAFRSTGSLTPDVLRRVQTPILIVGANHDRLVSSRAIRRAAKLLPKAELLVFPRAAHEILRESDPVRLAALARIDDFLDHYVSS